METRNSKKRKAEKDDYDEEDYFEEEDPDDAPVEAKPPVKAVSIR